MNGPILRVGQWTRLMPSDYEIPVEAHFMMTYGNIEVDDVPVVTLVYDHPENVLEVAEMFNTFVEAQATWQVLLDFEDNSMKFLLHVHNEETDHINFHLAIPEQPLIQLATRIMTNQKLLVRAEIVDDSGTHVLMAVGIRPDLLTINWSTEAFQKALLYSKRN